MKFREKKIYILAFIIVVLSNSIDAAGSPSSRVFKNSDYLLPLNTGKLNLTCYYTHVLYPFGPECADIEVSKDLTRSEVINLGFNLTLMGHKFERAWVNQHGLISFQESFLGQTLSQEDWPHPKYPYVDDPVFIAPFYAQTDLAGDKTEDLTETRYGRILYKVIRRMDLPQIYSEEEKFIYHMTMSILDEAQKQIRESVASGEEFIASHALIATWKSVSFLGNSLSNIDERPRNTFQAGIFTNTNITYAIFNYENIEWYAATSQGGNPETGTGGKAAKIGFNRGNGTLWYPHKPFSENAQLIQSLSHHSNVAIPGRFIYRIDEWIQPAGCLDLDFDIDKTIYVWPRSGNVLGGQEVNVTGPCFMKSPFFLCKWGDGFDAPVTVGETTLINVDLSDIRGRCIMPAIFYNGRVNLSISLDNGETYDWKTEFNIVDPLRYPPKVELVNINDWHSQSSPARLLIKWNRHDLSYAESDLVNVELWGYYEDDLGPHWDMIQIIATKKLNKGSFGFDVAPNRAPNETMARTYKLGAIAVSLDDLQYPPYQQNPDYSKFKRVFSALHPMGWWRNDEMKFFYDKRSYLFGNSRGKNWAEDQCRWWHEFRRRDRYWMDELELCPPTLMFAIGDAGVWAPDPSCNMYGDYNELNCLQHKGAQHCVITLKQTISGSGNRCCYDSVGNLMYTNDTHSGSTPDRYHMFGMAPYNTYGKVPGLSHYFHDIVPYYLCCHWSNLCESYLYLRETKDARGYKEPRMAAAYGDPHLITFDGKDYTFNGKGEFTLFRSKKFDFRLQARFEQPPNATYALLSSKGQINATRITAIATGQDDSDFVEVRARISPSQIHDLRCDVLVNGKTYYFNYTEEKIQIFKNVFVISPLHDEHQSNITIMFNSSGVGVNVECMYGMIHVRAAAPFSMFKETSGLLGYWDNITANDFMSPDGSTNQLTLKPDLLYQRFGMAWRMRDESESIFHYSGSWNFDTFHDQRPMIKEWQRFRPWFTQSEVPFPSNVSFTKEELMEACEGDEQCLYDGAAMGSIEIGVATKNAHRYYRLMHESMKSVNSCGIYPVKGGIRHLSKGNYLTGTVMKISCERGYTLFGWNEFYCNWNATWLPTNGQWIDEFRAWPYCEHYHITAIRWTSIGISILYVLCLIAALVYHFFFKKQDTYLTKANSQDQNDFIPFKEPTDETELKAMGKYDEEPFYRDGFVPTIKMISKLTYSANSLDKIVDNNNITESERDLSNLSAQPISNLEKPYVLLQIPERENQINATENLVIDDVNPYENDRNMSRDQEQDDSFSNGERSFISNEERSVDAPAQSLHQKQYSNPSLIRMKRLKEQQQKRIQSEVNNQLNNNLNTENEIDQNQKQQTNLETIV